MMIALACTGDVVNNATMPDDGGSNVRVPPTDMAGQDSGTGDIRENEDTGDHLGRIRSLLGEPRELRRGLRNGLRGQSAYQRRQLRFLWLGKPGLLGFFLASSTGIILTGNTVLTGTGGSGGRGGNGSVGGSGSSGGLGSTHQTTEIGAGGNGGTGGNGGRGGYGGGGAGGPSIAIVLTTTSVTSLTQANSLTPGVGGAGGLTSGTSSGAVGRSQQVY